MKSPHLPLLRSVSSLHATDLLADVAIVACQHLLATQLTLLDELVSLGLAPQNFFLLGKSYSTNTCVFREFGNRGVDVSPLSLHYDNHTSFDEQFDVAVSSFLQHVEERLRRLRPRKVIVVDVGGGLLAAAASRLGSFEVPVVGIEQTSSGHARAPDWPRAFALIDVACSKAKRIEANLLAELASAHLQAYLQRVPLESPRILVMGQGAVGAALTRRLRQQHHVLRYDRNPNLSDLHGDLGSHAFEFDVIIGATGTTVLRALDLAPFRRAFHLISLSSSDREFDAVELRRHLPRSTNPHEHCRYGRIELPNGGFPINFDGSETSLRDEQAQLIVALMLAAICQAARLPARAGAVELDAGMQASLVDEFGRLGAP